MADAAQLDNGTPSRWTVEPADPELDSPPEGHHDQPDTDPPDLPPVVEQ